MDCTVREAIEIDLHLTISTERVAFVSINHGSLLSVLASYCIPDIYLCIKTLELPIQNPDASHFCSFTPQCVAPCMQSPKAYLYFHALNKAEF
jgi:hypothetical protein